ncbi:MAG: GWxTD domain-containing protein [Burkholderiales bacterium]
MLATHRFRFQCCALFPFIVSVCIATVAQSAANQPPVKHNNFLSQPLPAVYQRWPDEDVRWIINDEERGTFNKLTTDDERRHFVEQFWVRRDPTPGTAENEFKEEHYRRIAYSNVHFAAQIMGALTDRGRIYIRYGPPDAVHAPAQNGVPKEVWHYDAFSSSGYIVSEGNSPRGNNKVDLEFVDDCRCNDYRLQTPEPK